MGDAPTGPTSSDVEREPTMTVEEFLHWHNDNRRRWELVDGDVREMVLPSSTHSELAARLSVILGGQLHQPFRYGTDAGLVLPDRDDAVYVADFIITRVPRSIGERLFPDPILVAEITAPGSEAYDRTTKLPDYMTLPSLREILFISSSSVHVELWQMADGAWRHQSFLGLGAVLVLTTIPVEFSLAEMYNGIGF